MPDNILHGTITGSTRGMIDKSYKGIAISKDKTKVYHALFTVVWQLFPIFFPGRAKDRFTDDRIAGIFDDIESSIVAVQLKIMSLDELYAQVSCGLLPPISKNMDTNKFNFYKVM